jgi:hypothetical protein
MLSVYIVPKGPEERPVGPEVPIFIPLVAGKRLLVTKPPFVPPPPLPTISNVEFTASSISKSCN